MQADTPWQAGRFDIAKGPKRVLFGRMYEDASIEEDVFPVGGRIFCIASAGCTAMALATHHRVTAVDINAVQIAYARRRIAGGPMQVGTAERVMTALRTLLPIGGWRRATVEEFLELSDLDEQRRFWRDRLDTTLFRVGFDVGLSVAGLRAVYASPFLEILPPHFGRVMRGRMERCFGTHPNRTNPFARALLLGELDDRLERRPAIDLIEADAAAYLEQCPARSFDGFTLSNILDGASPAYRGRLFTAVRHAAGPDARVVLRSFAEPVRASAENLAARDRSMLWGTVAVHAAPSLEVG